MHPKPGLEYQRISIDRSKLSEDEPFEHAIEMISSRQMGFRKAADFFQVSKWKLYKTARKRGIYAEIKKQNQAHVRHFIIREKPAIHSLLHSLSLKDSYQNFTAGAVEGSDQRCPLRGAGSLQADEEEVARHREGHVPPSAKANLSSGKIPISDIS